MSQDLKSENVTPSIQCEVLKVALNQTKDGYALVLRLHPNDIPDGLLRAPVGQRYMMVMVPFEDDESRKFVPVGDMLNPPEAQSRKKLEAKMMRVVQRPEFKLWLLGRGYRHDGSLDSALDALVAALSNDTEAPVYTFTEWLEIPLSTRQVDAISDLLFCYEDRARNDQKAKAEEGRR